MRKPRRPKREQSELNVHNAIMRATTKDEARAAYALATVYLDHHPDDVVIRQETEMLTMLLTAPDSAFA